MGRASWQAGSRRDRRGRDAALLFLAFPFGNPNKVSPGILPPPQPRAGGPPRPASSPQAEVGRAGARGRRGPRVGTAAPYPWALLLRMLEQPLRGCWGHPEPGGLGQPGDPHPHGVPPPPRPRGAPVAAAATGFTLPVTPPDSASPSELPPRAAAGPCKARQVSPWCCSGTPTRHPWDVGQAAEGRGGRLAACRWQLSSRRERVSSADITHAASLEQGTPRAVCRDTEPGMGCTRKGAAGFPASGGSSPVPGDVRIPVRVCLKSLPPSLPGEELLPLNWRMLQAPADEPEE